MSLIRSGLFRSIVAAVFVCLFIGQTFAATGASSVAVASNVSYASNALGGNNGTFATMNSGGSTLALSYSSTFGGGIRAYVRNPSSSQAVNVEFRFNRISGGTSYGAGSTVIQFAPNYSGSVLLSPSGTFNQVTLVKNSGIFWVDAVLAS